MTPAERALLLAVAKRMTCQLNEFKGDTYVGLIQAIAAVEAEATAEEATPEPMQSSLDTFEKILHAAATDPEPLTEGKSCPTCRFEKGAECLAAGGYTLDDNGICQDWQPKPTEGKSCETCSSYLLMYDKCLYPRDGECLPTHKYWQPKPTEGKSCETCDKQRHCSQNVSVNFCGPERLSWSRRPTEADVCPTCNDDGDIDDGSLSGKQCPDCNGTGKKENK